MLLDVRMPGMDGLLSCAGRTIRPHHRIPVVVLTSCGETESAQRAYALGARSFLTKPLGLKDFENMVRNFQPWLVPPLPARHAIQNHPRTASRCTTTVSPRSTHILVAVQIDAFEFARDLSVAHDPDQFRDSNLRNPPPRRLGSTSFLACHSTTEFRTGPCTTIGLWLLWLGLLRRLHRLFLAGHVCCHFPFRLFFLADTSRACCHCDQ